MVVLLFTDSIEFEIGLYVAIASGVVFLCGLLACIRCMTGVLMFALCLSLVGHIVLD